MCVRVNFITVEYSCLTVCKRKRKPNYNHDQLLLLTLMMNENNHIIKEKNWMW